MGYSISVAFKTKAQRDSAMAFLKAQDLQAMLSADPTQLSQHFGTGDDLAYPPKRIPAERLLGIGGSLISDSSWSALIFVASRLPGAVPKIYYDSSEVFRVGQSEESDLRADANGLFLPRQGPSFFKSLLTLVQGLQGKTSERERVEAWVAKANAALAAQEPAAPAATGRTGPKRRR